MNKNLQDPATKNDLKELEKKFDQKFSDFEEKIDQKFITTEKKTLDGFEEMARMINHGFNDVIQLIKNNHWEVMSEIHDIQAKQANAVYKFEFNHLKERVTKLENNTK